MPWWRQRRCCCLGSGCGARCAGEPIGPAKRVGGTLAYAVFYEVSAETERLTRAASGIYGPVLEDEMEVMPHLKVA